MAKFYQMVKILIVRSFRDVSTNIILIAMPLALIFILGTTFSSANTQGFNLSDMTVNISAEKESDFAEGLIEVLEGTLSEDSRIVYSDFEESKPLLENNKITCFIEVDEENKTVKIYKNQIINFDASMIEGVVRTYTNRANTIYTIAVVNPQYLSSVDHEDTNITQKIGLSKEINLTAKDYYGIAMTVLFVMYGAMTAIYEIQSDRTNGLLNRMEIANVKPLTVLASKMLGYTIVSAIRVYGVIFISYITVGIYWGTTPLLSMAYIFMFIMAITAVGIAVGYSIKEVAAANTIINVFIVFSAFVGGTYIQVDNIPILKDIGRYLSVNWWANKGLMTSIFSNDNTILYQGMIMYSVVIVVLGIYGVYTIGKGEKKFDR